MNSKGGHYSNTTNLSLMGVDLKRKTFRIKVTKSNKIDVKDFELQLGEKLVQFSSHLRNCKDLNVSMTMES